jgi:hypothetical protein
MKPGMFVWRKSGRAWVADIGKLSLIVNERGSLKTGLRWRVVSIFGAQSFKMGGTQWRDRLEDALLEAESYAVAVGIPALRKLGEATAARSVLRDSR